MTRPVALILGSCVSLQFGAALATQLFASLGSWGVTALRLAIAAAILLALGRPRVHGWTRRQWRAALVLGVALAGMNGFFYAALARIPLGVAVAVECLGPLLLAAALSRRRRDLACIALAAAGIALLGLDTLTGTATLDPVGVGFALVAAAFWALYILATARVGECVDGSGGLAVALAVAALCVLPAGAAGAARVLTEPHLLWLAAGTAILASALPYTLELAALRRLPRHVFGVLLSLEPIVALTAGWLLLGQPASVVKVAAIVFVVTASVGVTTAGRRTSPVADDAPATVAS